MVLWFLRSGAVAIVLQIVISAATATPDKSTANHEVITVKRSFLNVLDNATIEILKECEDTRSVGGYEASYSLFDVHSPPNNRQPPMHHHTVYTEIIEVLSGVVYFEAIVVENNNEKKNHILKLETGDTFEAPANQLHKWWTTEEEGSTFRVTTTPCFDGFHEGLELVANVARGNGIAADRYPKYDQWNMIQKTRFHAILWVMMATELDEGMVASLLGLFFEAIAGTKANVQMAADLRKHFLPHLKTSLQHQQEKIGAVEDTMNTRTGEEL